MTRTATPSPVLSADERTQLQALLRCRTTQHVLALRIRLILESAKGMNRGDVAATFGVTPQTVLKWIKRFSQSGLRGLYDAPHSGMPRKIQQAHVDQVVARTLGKSPPNGLHWTTRAMAREMDMSQSAISRIWRSVGLKPTCQASFRLSPDPLFEDKICDMVGLYLDPPIKALVLCVDGKGPIQIIERDPSQSDGGEHAHAAGTTLFAKLNQVMGNTGRRPRGGRRLFLQFLRSIDANTPPELDIHLVMDNPDQDLGTSTTTWLIHHPRIRIHWTSSNAVWLNEFKQCFQGLTERQVMRGMPKSTRSLLDAVRHHLNSPNRPLTRLFMWSKSAEEIRVAFRNFRIRAYTLVR